MIVKGKLQYIGDLKTGISPRTGEEWALREIGVEYTEHYGLDEPKTRSHRILATISGEEARTFNLPIGTPVQINVHYIVREYADRLYTSNKAWGITLC